MITAQQVKQLRDQTLAGFADCKKALTECDGDMEKAAEFLRKKGLKVADKKAGRQTAAGLIHSYIHPGGRVGVLVDVRCETDFVAKTDQFRQFVNNLCLQIAAMNPLCLEPCDIPHEVREKETEIRTAQLVDQGKPEAIIPKIVEGQIKKWEKEVVLLEQPFVKEPKKSIKQLRLELIATLQENIQIRRFVRWEVGQ
jgi:elongation factor Ts